MKVKNHSLGNNMLKSCLRIISPNMSPLKKTLHYRQLTAEVLDYGKIAN